MTVREVGQETRPKTAVGVVDENGAHTEGIVVKNVSHWFASRGREPVQALDDVSLTIDVGEFVTIVGPSGCGKSTLLKVIAGLTRPTSGVATFQGRPIDGPSPERGVVFQELALLPWRTVRRNIGHGLEIAGVRKPVREQRVAELIQTIGLTGFEDHYPHELSGGMRQRVAVARTWATDPTAILMDEPFGAVDAQTRLSLQQELLSMAAGSRKAILFITHSVEEAVFLGDRVVVMSRRPGVIKEDVRIDRARDQRTLEEFLADPEIHEIQSHIMRAVREEV